MTQTHFKHIYGPVHSWRMGMSLGVDPISTQQKVCNFNCTYCQLGCLGCAEAVKARQAFVPVREIIEELKKLEPDVFFDVLTFSGNGEPTLAANLGEMISAVKCFRREAIAVITNGALLGRRDVQADLHAADMVLVKLEAADEAMFQAVNRPAPGITFTTFVDGIRDFRRVFAGRFILQVMFIEKNRAQAPAIAALTGAIGADEVQLNTPLRAGADRPLSPEVMTDLKKHFAGQNVRSVYEEDKVEYHPFDAAATARRHGQYKV